ncbi:ABC transporter permease, partial [Streptomyces sp. DSM 41636]
VRALAGEQHVDAAQIAEIKASLGLDQPIWQQYLNYLANLFQGDLGTQIGTKRPVAEVIADAYPITVRLGIFAFVFTVVAGISLGIVAGLKAESLRDRGLLGLTLVLISMPSFVLGFLVQYFFAFQLGIANPNVSLEPTNTELLMP